MKRAIKSVLGAVMYRTGAYRRFFRGRAVLVNFHRVDDRYATNAISCSVATFEEFCEFFRRYFVVVSLSELLGKLERGDSIDRHLVITVDDGYLDNHAIMAPRLKALGLPASFYIATDFMGTSRIPWWDAEQGIRTEWMTWDQVRSLHAQGFEIGAHTCNHVDLGVVSGDEAAHEIIESGQRLTRELGAPVTLFSYPYGGLDRMTEANRDVVRAHYRCCVSAHSGMVTPTTDPYYMLRIPISQWHRSAYQFGFETMFER